MAYRSAEVIEVKCFGEKVGALALDPNVGYYAFEYYPEFRSTGMELAPLTLPLSTGEPVVFTYLPVDTYHRLPAFIADSLPDRFGNNLINAWMANNGIDADMVTPLDRLAYIGRRGMGALEFHPASRGRGSKPSALEMNELVTAARKTLDIEFDTSNEALSQLISVGTSAGGARAKAVVGYHPRLKKFVSGQFKVPKGYEHWLIKFDIPEQERHQSSREYGRIEYAYYLMALECGIEMMPSTLFEVAGRAHFMTQRFDRNGNDRLHSQTLCAMAELDFNQKATHDYRQLFQTVKRLDLGFESIDETFRRMVFNVCLGNNDDHTKNFSFLYTREGGWRLAPAYDLTHAMNPDSYWLEQHLMGINNKFKNISRDDMLKIADEFHVRSPGAIIDRTAEVAKMWPDFAKKADMKEADVEKVTVGINQCLKSL